jgi:hypothetical protein
MDAGVGKEKAERTSARRRGMPRHVERKQNIRAKTLGYQLILR